MDPLFDDTTPFERDTGLRAGLTARDLAGPRYRRIMRNIYVSRDIPDTLVVRCRAALLRAPDDAAVSHESAARLWCPAVPSSSSVHLALSRDAKIVADGVKVHRFRYRLDVAARHGLRVTSPGQTFVHLAVRLDLVDLVVFGDQLVKRGLVDVAGLQAYAQGWTAHGARAASEAAAYVRDRVESPQESRTRLLLVLAGLPEPETNLPVCDVDGREVYRLDMAFPEFMLAIEYDGRWHRTAEQRRRDEVRRAQLRELGWTVLVVTVEDLFEEPEALLLRIQAVMTELGMAVPRHLRDDFRRYFPTRSVA